MPELFLCSALRFSHSRLLCALRCCLLLLQLCLLFKHLRSSAFSPFSTAFCHFYIFHTSLSPIFDTSLSLFFSINSCAFWYCVSFLLPDEASVRNVVNSTVCCSTPWSQPNSTALMRPERLKQSDCLQLYIYIYKEKLACSRTWTYDDSA